MRLAAIYPRGSWFTAHGATAMDLCVRDLAKHLPISATARVLAADTEDPFEDVPFYGLPANRAREVDPAALKKALAAEKADVHWVQTSFEYARQIKRWFPGTPVLIHRHRMESPKRLKALWRQAAYLRTIDGLIYPSNAARMRSPFKRTPHFTVPNAIDTRAFRPHGDKEPWLVYSGRLAESKGVVALAEGCAAFLTEHPNWRLRIFGIPDGEDATEAQMKQLLEPVMGQVQWSFNAPLSDVMQTLSHASVALAPSLAPEGFGRFPMEAMTAGCVVVHSRQEAFLEVVADTGIALRTVTGPAIATALVSLLQSPDKLAGFGAKARARAVQAYDIRAASTALAVVCRRILLDHSPAT